MASLPEQKTPLPSASRQPFFHWGLHGWGAYGVVGLALGYFAYNRGLPLTIRSAFYPLFGDRIWGWPGHIIDTFAIFAGLFGLATSLGLGVKQLTSGLNYLFGCSREQYHYGGADCGDYVHRADIGVGGY